jgi:hypothetical protein
VAELYIALLHIPGAFIHGAARADSVVEAVAAFASEEELLGIEWLQTYDSLPDRGQQSEPVQGVLAKLGDGDVALDWAYTYPTDPETDAADTLKQQVEGFVEGWIEGAVERFGEFEFGDYAFVAEMHLDGDVEIGWAYQGALTRAAELFERAADDARD